MRWMPSKLPGAGKVRPRADEMNRSSDALRYAWVRGSRALGPLTVLGGGSPDFKSAAAGRNLTSLLGDAPISAASLKALRGKRSAHQKEEYVRHRDRGLSPSSIPADLPIHGRIHRVDSLNHRLVRERGTPLVRSGLLFSSASRVSECRVYNDNGSNVRRRYRNA